jgi:putative flippase GtrA
MRAGMGDNLTASCRVSHERELVRRRWNGAGAGRGIAVRWLKFNLVGGLGIAVQLALLLGLKKGFHLNYLPATALAVEAAVVHNFLWHERYTWADRVKSSRGRSLPRLLRFNLTAGGVSIAGNLALMKAMVGLGHMNYLVANGVAIALCSLVNFLVSEEWVFEGETKNQRD